MKKIILSAILALTSLTAYAANLTGQVPQPNGMYLCLYSDGSALILPVCPGIK